MNETNVNQIQVLNCTLTICTKHAGSVKNLLGNRLKLGQKLGLFGSDPLPPFRTISLLKLFFKASLLAF